MIAKKNAGSGDEIDVFPDSMRQVLAMQALESGRPFPRHLLGRTGAPMGQTGSGGMALGGDASVTGKVGMCYPSRLNHADATGLTVLITLAVIQHFTCRSLSIGSWRRVGQNAMDLVVFYSPDKACITYYINNDSAGYKIEFPFAFIKQISLESGESDQNASGLPPRPSGLVIELSRPPNFFMDSSGSGGFYQCGDFTEDQQASRIMMHHLGGHGKVLSGQLAKLMALESYRNRHSHFEMNTIPASAPVSPAMAIARPASQPSVQFARPQVPPPHIGMFQDSHKHAGIGLHPGRGAGHKRQRSRSVPAAIDFSMLHSPMPTFHIQQPSGHLHQDLEIFQPLPQHPGQGATGSNLRVDTSQPGFGMDFRSFPLSTTTTATQSEFGFPSAHQSLTMSATDFNTPYNLPFLSPSPMIDPVHMLPPSHTPLSQMSHPDPVIADHSPPLSGMHRSASADMFSMTHDANLPDDGIMLSELYSKQNLNLGMASPCLDEGAMMPLHDMSEYHTPRESMELPLMPWSTIDPSSLKTDNST
jgi:hypothetical protein